MTTLFNELFHMIDRFPQFNTRLVEVDDALEERTKARAKAWRARRTATEDSDTDSENDPGADSSIHTDEKKAELEQFNAEHITDTDFGTHNGTGSSTATQVADGVVAVPFEVWLQLLGVAQASREVMVSLG